MTSSLAQRTSMPGGHWDTQRCSQLRFPLSLGSQLLTYLTNVIPTMFHSGRKSDRRQNLSRGGACPCAGSACTRHVSPQPRERQAGQQKAHPHLSLLSGAFFFFVCPGNPARQRELGVQTDMQCEHFSASFRSNYSVISSNLHIKLDEKHRLISVCGS